MPKKIRPDDESSTPRTRSKLEALRGLILFTGKGNRVVIKVDKEAPEAFMAARYIELAPGSRALHLDAQRGFVSIAIASANPGTEVLLYEPHLGLRETAEKNLKANWTIDNARLTEEEDTRKITEEKVENVIYQPRPFSSLGLIEGNLRLARTALTKKGKLWLITHKKKGGEQQEAMAAEIFNGEPIDITRGKGGWRIFEFENPYPLTPEKSQIQRREVSFSVAGKEYHCQTEPSLFSKEDIDKGTKFLLETILSQGRKGLGEAERILDLGCGWGAIGIVLATEFPQAKITMVDIDTRAAKMASDNLKMLKLQKRAEVVATANVRQLSGEFDFVISNPPFHIPQRELEKLFAGARNKTKKRGKMIIAVEDTYREKISTTLEKAFKGRRPRTIAYDSKIKYSVLEIRK